MHHWKKSVLFRRVHIPIRRNGILWGGVPFPPRVQKHESASFAFLSPVERGGGKLQKQGSHTRPRHRGRTVRENAFVFAWRRPAPTRVRSKVRGVF